METNNKKSKSLLDITNNQILYLNIILFLALFSMVAVITFYFFNTFYRKYIDEKLEFVKYQFNSAINNAFKDLEIFISSGVNNDSAIFLEVDPQGRVTNATPHVKTYENFYFGNSELFKKTLEFGEYVSGFTKKFLTEKPVIVVSKKSNNRVFFGLFSVENIFQGIFQGSKMLENSQNLFFVDEYGFGVKINQKGLSFVDFLEKIGSREKDVPLLNLRYSNVDGKIHVLFHKDLSHGFKSIITIPFMSTMKPYIYSFLILVILAIFSTIVTSRFFIRKVKVQLGTIQLLSEHMLKSFGTTPIDLNESPEIAEEIRNLFNSFNKMVREAHNRQEKLSLAVRKLSNLNEQIKAINSILVSSDEMFRKLLFRSSEPLAVLKKYIQKIFKIIPNFKYFGYNGEFGTLKMGEKSGKLVVMRLLDDEEIQLSIEKGENNEAKFFENVIIQEISSFIRELKLAVRIHNLIRYDYLTKLFNRKYFEELFERELLIADRYKRVFSLVIIDMDNFKTFNDEFGHQFGDKVLQRFAELLLRSFRKSDIIGRYGGDEFEILMLETSKHKAFKKIQEINRKISTLSIDGTTIKIDFSFGIAEFPKDGRTRDELLKVADSELYKTKNLKKQLRGS